MRRKGLNPLISFNHTLNKLENEHENIEDECKDLRDILKRIEEKFNEMYKELKSLSSIQIEDKEELSTKFVDVSKKMITELTKTSNK